MVLLFCSWPERGTLAASPTLIKYQTRNIHIEDTAPSIEAVTIGMVQAWDVVSVAFEGASVAFEGVCIGVFSQVSAHPYIFNPQSAYAINSASQFAWHLSMAQLCSKPQKVSTSDEEQSPGTFVTIPVVT